MNYKAPTTFAVAILAGLQHKPTYGGTVGVAERAVRRARGRRARVARRLNRGI